MLLQPNGLFLMEDFFRHKILCFFNIFKTAGMFILFIVWTRKSSYGIAKSGVLVQSRAGQVHVDISVKETNVNHLLYSLHEMSSFHLSSLQSTHIPLLTVSQETKPLLPCVGPSAHRSSALWVTDYWISTSSHCNDERGYTLLRLDHRNAH